MNNHPNAAYIKSLQQFDLFKGPTVFQKQKSMRHIRSQIGKQTKIKLNKSKTHRELEEVQEGMEASKSKSDDPIPIVISEEKQEESSVVNEILTQTHGKSFAPNQTFMTFPPEEVDQMDPGTSALLPTPSEYSSSEISSGELSVVDSEEYTSDYKNDQHWKKM